MIYCNICGGQTTLVEVKEQMLGLNEYYTYNKCNDCGHTHLSSPPENLSKYYNTKSYYSFNSSNISFFSKGLMLIKKALVFFNSKKSLLFSSSLKALLSIKGINKSISILDYGCGDGQFVEELKGLGFANVKGFDPYLPNVKFQNNDVYLFNDTAYLSQNCWDIITLNHVFEHIYQPIEELQKLNKLLCKRGKLILRFPIIDSFAFEKYQENWVQFDAPRHLNLFTRKSIQLAVEKAGNFKIIAMYDDSFHFQFTGSDLYTKNLSLSPKDNNRLKRLLSFKTYQYHFLAKKLNKQKRGDQMAIILEQL